MTHRVVLRFDAAERNRAAIELVAHAFLKPIQQSQFMVTRRTDARRRRVLTEEFVPTDEAHDSHAVDCEARLMRSYSFGANRRNQPKTTDLIPKRVLSLSLFFGVLLLLIAGINMLSFYGSEFSDAVGETGVASLQLSGNGTLSNWLCSVSLFLCSAICIQLYLLRQHKRDDYGGMYRVWILMSVLFVVASLDCVLDLRTIAAKLFEFATQRSLLQTPWLMVTIELIVLGLLALRMLFEVRASKASMACLTIVWLCFVGCATLSRFALPASIGADLGVDQQLVYGNCMLCGCLGTLAALTVYTRFVFLDAHGLIARRARVAKPAVKKSVAKKSVAKKPVAKKVKKFKETAQMNSTDREVANDVAAEPDVSPAATSVAEKPAKSKLKKAAAKNSSASTSPAKSAPPQRPQNEPNTEPTETSETPETLSMSKTERRRQRKLAKRAARDAA